MNLYTDEAGGFVVAGSDTFSSLMSRFYRKLGGAEYIPVQNLHDFFPQAIDKFLLSFGTNIGFKDQTVHKNHPNRISKLFDTVLNEEFTKDIRIFLDSGGFQISMGAVGKNYIDGFIQMYHDFLRKEHLRFERAFVLDVPPGPGSSDVFHSWRDIEDLNRKSYNVTRQLPKEILDKMIYIHHFRTPSLYKIWQKFLWEDKLAEGFKNFGTGGMVANLGTDSVIPIIMYSIPLATLVRYAKSKGMKEFNFHILGGANFCDIMYHFLFTKHVKKIHDIDIHITYDSSVVFKGLAVGRYVPSETDNHDMIKMYIKTGELHKRWDSTGTIQDVLYRLLNGVADRYGFKQLNSDDNPVYHVDGTFDKPVHMYSMVYVMHIYRQVELMNQAFADEAYPYYEAGDYDGFDRLCRIHHRHMNQGRASRKQKAKSAAILRSMKLLENLDEDYSEHVLNKYTSTEDVTLVQEPKTLLF